MVVEAGIRNLFECEIARQRGTGKGKETGSVGAFDERGSSILEVLILVDDLNSMLVLFLGPFLSNVCKMAIDRQNGRGRRVSGLRGRTGSCRHDDKLWVRQLYKRISSARRDTQRV